MSSTENIVSGDRSCHLGVSPALTSGFVYFPILSACAQATPVLECGNSDTISEFLIFNLANPKTSVGPKQEALISGWCVLSLNSKM